MNFGDRLKAYRKKNNLSQKELADKLGISRNYLSEVENGKKSFSSSIEEKAEKLMGKDVDKPLKMFQDLSMDKDLKSIYKKKIVGDMQSLGVYKKEFEQIADIYADILVQYRDAHRRYQEEKEEIELTMIATGKKPPQIANLEALRKDIITYSDRLLLNPKSIQGIIDDDKPKSKLAEMLKSIG